MMSKCPGKEKRQGWTHPIRRRIRPVNGLHDTALLVGHVAHPVGLARADEHMRAPALDVPVQQVLLVDLEAARVPHRAAVAVVQALVAVARRVRLGEQLRDPRGRAGAGAGRPPAQHRRHERLERDGHLLLHGHALRRGGGGGG